MAMLGLRMAARTASAIGLACQQQGHPRTPLRELIRQYDQHQRRENLHRFRLARKLKNRA